MGAQFAKELAMRQGYYIDMVKGFITDTGGYIIMLVSYLCLVEFEYVCTGFNKIAKGKSSSSPRISSQSYELQPYPEELLKVPRTCTSCHGSNLKTYKMLERLDWHRARYREYVDYIVETRVANGESDPYHGFGGNKKRRRPSKTKCKHKSYKYIMQPNNIPPLLQEESEVTTLYPNSNEVEGPTYIPVTPEDLVVCRDCGKGRPADCKQKFTFFPHRGHTLLPRFNFQKTGKKKVS